MLSTPFTCCSIGVATDCSTTSAEAPGYVVSTRIVGGARLGYCSMGSFNNVATPSKTVTIAMTIATVGRRMKKSDMDQCRAEVSDTGVTRAESAAAGAWVARTFTPGRTFCIPSTTITVPATSPVSTTQSLPTRAPALTGRTATALSDLRTHTPEADCSARRGP